MSTYPVGYTILHTRDLSRGRPVIIDAWYPAIQTARETPHDYGLGRGHVAERAPPVAGELRPVIVLSHGAFGSSRNYSWIGEYLAGNGYIVAGVSHFKESPVYGPETIDPASALQPWLRPQDCTFALDYLFSQSEFQKIADPARIGALGHSSGGATAIALGGAVFDPRAMQQYCVSDTTERDRGCVYARGAEPGRRESLRDRPPVMTTGSGLSWRSTLRWVRAMMPHRFLQYPCRSTLSEQCTMTSCPSNITPAGTRALSREHR